jgi:hypothetical protein
LAAGVALAILAGLALWAGYRHHAGRVSDEAIGQFLARHWASPIAPQGTPPATHAPDEASLDPARCGLCHTVQLVDWRTSLHSRAFGPGLAWQLHTFDQSQGNDCLRCHAPLASRRPPRRANAAGPVPAINRGVVDLHRQGLVRCLPRGRTSDTAGASADRRSSRHLVAQRAPPSDSRFCATCHQFLPEVAVNGKPLENTYEEWRSSRHAREGRHCQGCHMPERRHLWRGIHDPEMTRQALHRELRVQRVDAGRINVTVTLANRGAGHYLPTYVVPKILVNAYLIGPGMHVLVGHHVIGRTVDVALANEVSDTRLPPYGRHELNFDVKLPPGAWRVVLRTEVARGTLRALSATFTSVERTSTPRPAANSRGAGARRRHAIPARRIDGCAASRWRAVEGLQLKALRARGIAMAWPRLRR